MVQATAAGGSARVRVLAKNPVPFARREASASLLFFLEPVSERPQKGTEVRRALGGGAIHPREVQAFVGMRDQVAEARRAREPVRKRRFQNTGFGQALKGLAIG